MKRQTLEQLPQVHVLGRTDGCRSPVSLYWTASGLEILFTGSELWLELEVSYVLNEPWISIELNGAWVGRQMLLKGLHTLCVIRSMSAGPKHIRILKDAQAMPDDPMHCIKVHALRFNGELLPCPQKPCRIEFVGDSITCGEGGIGSTYEEDWAPVFSSALNNYAVMTADRLDAEFRLVSLGGWGIRSGYDNNPSRIISRIYGAICGAVDTLGTQIEYDFSAYPADVVVINLGTNDDAATTQPAWPDLDGGLFHQERTPEGLELWTKAAVTFLNTVRLRNPTAKIVWAYGMMGDAMWPAICDAVTRCGDANTSACKLPDTTAETVGARQHPGRASHLNAAKVLSAFLKEALVSC